MTKEEQIIAMQQELELYKAGKSNAKSISISMKEISLWLATLEK
ncbi:MAG: hypothetical protein U9N39_04665 [Campylobacterota bacterium]|nr:hypothetical protein [Campylobacterota bacterium]